MSTRELFSAPLRYIANRIEREQWKKNKLLIGSAINDGRPREIAGLLAKALQSRSNDIRNSARSLEVLYDLECDAIRQNIARHDRIPLYWAQGPRPGNLGDSLNPILIQGLTNSPPRFTKPENNALLAIGSIADRVGSNGSVWGSGFLGENYPVQPAAHYHAIRGPISRNMIEKAGGHCPAIYGDPAILTPLIFPAPQQRAGRIGVILHYHHLHLAKPGDAHLISVYRASRQDFAEFISELTQCEYIFSSSLHGLILARAYGIPARRLISREMALAGDDMKFEDYRLGVGASAKAAPLFLEDLDSFDEASLRKLMINDAPVAFDARPLLEAFPYRERIINSLFERAGNILA